MTMQAFIGLFLLLVFLYLAITVRNAGRLM